MEFIVGTLFMAFAVMCFMFYGGFAGDNKRPKPIFSFLWWLGGTALMGVALMIFSNVYYKHGLIDGAFKQIRNENEVIITNDSIAGVCDTTIYVFGDVLHR